MDSVFYCSTCKAEENDHNKIVQCDYCLKCEHLSCRGVYGVAAEKLRAKKFFCSLNCAEISSRISSTAGMEKQLMDEISKVLTEVQGTNAELRKVQNTIGEIQRTNNLFADKVDTMLKEMQHIREDHQLLKNDVMHLQDEQLTINETVTDLEKQLDKINRAALATHAVVLGVPTTNEENLRKIITDIALAVKCELPTEAIVEIKRLLPKDGQSTAGKPVPIKVVFSDVTYKEDFFAKKKNHGLLLSSAIGANSGAGGTRIILRDELTNFGMKLLKQTRIVQDQAAWKFVWPGRDGVILAKATADSKVEKIRNFGDLQQLQSKRPLDSSLLNSTMMSSTSGPSSKHQKQL